MAGYIGKSQGVTQVDGYTRSEADAEYVNDPNAVITVSGSNVGIGTDSPAQKLEISGAITPTIRLTDTSYNQYAEMATANAGSLLLKADAGNGGTGDTYIGFEVDGTERMRIDSSGNLLVGTTSQDSGAKFTLNDSGQVGISFVSTGTSAKGRIYFKNDNGVVGQIYTDGSSTAYATSSDYRLKTDVQPMTGATERLKALKPVNFEWISNGERVDGFLAHEAQEVVPEAVTGTKDAMRTEEYEVTPAVLDDDGNVVTEAVMGEREVPDYQGIDQSKLVPLLVATIQELEARIAALESV